MLTIGICEAQAIQSFEDARLAAYLSRCEEPPDDPRDCPGWEMEECWGCDHRHDCFPESFDW